MINWKSCMGKKPLSFCLHKGITMTENNAKYCQKKKQQQQRQHTPTENENGDFFQSHSRHMYTVHTPSTWISCTLLFDLLTILRAAIPQKLVKVENNAAAASKYFLTHRICKTVKITRSLTLFFFFFFGYDSLFIYFLFIVLVVTVIFVRTKSASFCVTLNYGDSGVQHDIWQKLRWHYC